MSLEQTVTALDKPTQLVLSDMMTNGEGQHEIDFARYLDLRSIANTDLYLALHPPRVSEEPCCGAQLMIESKCSFCPPEDDIDRRHAMSAPDVCYRPSGEIVLKKSLGPTPGHDFIWKDERLIGEQLSPLKSFFCNKVHRDTMISI